MADQPFRLAHIEKGSGPILVLLHGFLESHAMWDYLNLDSHFRTISIDLPGHGISKDSAETFSMDHLAKCLKATLDFLQIKEFHLIGHSLGGYLVLEFLHQYGINGQTILLNSNFWQDDAKKQADRLRVANLVLKNKNLFIREAIPGLFSYADECRDEIEELIAEAKEIPAEHIASISIAMRNRDDHKRTIKKWSKKISILQGESDKLCPPDRMEREVAGLELNYIRIPKAGHMSHLENTPFVKESILEVLNKKD